MQIVHRKLLVFGLLGAFAAQGALVYGDRKAADHPPLTDLERAGRAIYLSRNCASCHQIFGFGGFLGPDLTNAAQRVPRARLAELLSKGSRQMPAFGLLSEDVDAVEAYLRAIDRAGIGVARHRLPPDIAAVTAAVQKAVQAVAAAGEGNGDVGRGHQLFTTFCASCHVPLRANPLGLGVAPDPTGIAARLSPAQIDDVLVHGRIARGMPSAPLTPEQRPDVIAFLQWLHGARAALVAACGEGTPLDLPWWEFK